MTKLYEPYTWMTYQSIKTKASPDEYIACSLALLTQ